MKKATIQKEKKGWLIIFEDGKKMSCFWTHLPAEIDGQPILVWTTKGPVDKIKWNEKEFTNQTSQTNISGSDYKKNQSHQKNDNEMNNNQARNPARAPYNFIPLNKTIISGQNPISDFNCYDNERLSGYIELNIKTLNPVFIRKEKGNSNFFAVDNGTPIIPGSSLRGLIRNIVEQVTCSRLLFTDSKRKYFFRNIKDNEYRNLMLDQSGNIKIKAEAGWLKRIGNKYYITPAVKDSNGLQFYRINGRCSNNNFSTIIDNNSVTLNLYNPVKIYFDNKKCQKIKTKFIDRKNVNLEYNILSDISYISKSTLQTGYVWATGYIQRKHFQWVINEKASLNGIDITDQMKIYFTDENRDEKIKIKEWTKNENEIPFFYIQENNTIVALGHTGMFRYPYNNNVSNKLYNHLPDESDLKKGSYQIDMTESIFGSTHTKASRVFFEDSYAVPEKVEIDNLEKYPKILNTPKPTTYQHYLEPQNNIAQSWNKNTVIRGFKNYWHKPSPNWAETSAEEIRKRANMFRDTQIKVLNKGEFIGKIRFENLTQEELGAILLAIDLPEKCCHKIGMGKPLGLGSIKISIKDNDFVLIKRRERYSKLFDENGQWYLGKDDDKKTIEDFKAVFCKYILDNLPDEEKKDINNNIVVSDIWNISRLVELKTILTFEHTQNKKSGFDWNERTRYMEITKKQYNEDGTLKMKEKPDGQIVPDTINEFAERDVLPSPSQVIRNDTYNDC